MSGVCGGTDRHQTFLQLIKAYLILFRLRLPLCGGGCRLRCLLLMIDRAGWRRTVRLTVLPV